MAWFELSGDARLGQCSTEGCGGQPTWRLEADGIGSEYCSGCAARIRRPSPVEAKPRGRLDANELWEWLFAETRDNVPDSLTDDVLARFAAHIDTVFIAPAEARATSLERELAEASKIIGETLDADFALWSSDSAAEARRKIYPLWKRLRALLSNGEA